MVLFFFILIETSILRGFRAALAFDIGVILSDIIFIMLAFWGSSNLQALFSSQKEWIKLFIGFILMAYGLFLALEKYGHFVHSLEKQQEKGKSGFSKLFLKGFLINIINLGVFFFWVSLISFVQTQFALDGYTVLLFLFIAIAGYLVVDLIKIFYAKKIGQRLTIPRQFLIRKAIAGIFLVLGMVAFVKFLSEV